MGGGVIEQVIYGDVLFIINFSMDFLALFITGKIMHLRQRTMALVLAACIGAFYAVAELFDPGSALFSLFLNAGVALLMCYIAYGADSAAVFWKASLLFLGVSFIMGGSMTAIYNLINSIRGTKAFFDGGVSTVYSEIPFSWLCFAAFVSAVLSIVIGRIFRKKTAANVLDVTLTHGGHTAAFSCLSDSGNLLREPVGGKPVIITSFDTLKPVLPPPLHSIFRRKNTSALADVDLKLLRHVRIIPISGAGQNRSGILLGFIPEKIVINGVEKEACVAVDTLGDNGKARLYGDCKGLAPAVLES